MQEKQMNILPSEYLFMMAGVAMLLSLISILLSEDFTLWVIAKIFYGVGVAFFLFDR